MDEVLALAERTSASLGAPACAVATRHRVTRWIRSVFVTVSNSGEACSVTRTPLLSGRPGSGRQETHSWRGISVQTGRVSPAAKSRLGLSLKSAYRPSRVLIWVRSSSSFKNGRASVLEHLVPNPAKRSGAQPHARCREGEGMLQPVHHVHHRTDVDGVADGEVAQPRLPKRKHVLRIHSLRRVRQLLEELQRHTQLDWQRRLVPAREYRRG